MLPKDKYVICLNSNAPFSDICLSHGEPWASVQLYQGWHAKRVLLSLDSSIDSGTSAPSHLLPCHFLMFHIALFCHNQLFKSIHAHHIQSHLAFTPPPRYLRYLCPLCIPAMTISGVLRGYAKVSQRAKAQSVALLRVSTSTISPSRPPYPSKMLYLYDHKSLERYLCHQPYRKFDSKI